MGDSIDTIWRTHREELTALDGPSTEVFFPSVTPEDLIACLDHLQANTSEYQTLCTWHPRALGEVATCENLADTFERLFNGAVTQFGVDYQIGLTGFDFHCGLLVAPASPVDLDINAWFNARDVFGPGSDDPARFRIVVAHFLTLRDLLGCPPAFLGVEPTCHPLDDAGDWIRLA